MDTFRPPSYNEAVVTIRRRGYEVTLYVNARDEDKQVELMTRCNREFSTPNQIGGPKMPAKEKPREIPNERTKRRAQTR